MIIVLAIVAAVWFTWAALRVMSERNIRKAGLLAIFWFGGYAGYGLFVLEYYNATR